jgi:hypothetical protein
MKPDSDERAYERTEEIVIGGFERLQHDGFLLWWFYDNIHF